MRMEISNHQPDVTLNAQFHEVVALIQDKRTELYRVANSALVDLYWQIGKYISQKILHAEWGDGVVKRLAAYITNVSPELKGFDDKNLWRMRQMYDAYNADEKLVPLAREITWTNNTIILRRCKTIEEREFYLRLTVKERLSKRELERQINSCVYERAMTSNVKLAPVVREMLPQANKVFKDSYVLEFITGKEAKPENGLRHALISKMKDFILELGKDFLYVDEEYHLQVGMSDFRIDLLFYHRELQCLIAFELKTEAFKPEHLGQLNFYLEALDRDVKKPHENPSIGVLLCKDKDDEVVEYALSRSLSPTMVAQYQLNLPDKKVLQQKMKELFEEGDEA